MSAGANLRVATQLLEAETGELIWTGRYDRPLSELAELQEELVEELAAHLGVQIQKVEMERALKKPGDLTAWEASIRAMVATSRGTFALGVAEGERAVAAAPDSATAHAVLALSLGAMFVAKPTERHWRDRAHTHIARALELDASHPSVHLWVGYALGSSGEAERALPYAEQAVRARPNIAIARQGLGQVYQMLDRNDESLAELTTAERLAPNAPGQFILSHHIAITLLRQHAFAAALERLDEAIRLLRNFADALYVRAMTLERLSRGEEALAEMRRAKASDLDLAGEARMIRQHSKYETWWWRNHEDLPLILATFQKLSDATEPGA